jgi:hypothetical protein
LRHNAGLSHLPPPNPLKATTTPPVTTPWRADQRGVGVDGSRTRERHSLCVRPSAVHVVPVTGEGVGSTAVHELRRAHRHRSAHRNGGHDAHDPGHGVRQGQASRRVDLQPDVVELAACHAHCAADQHSHKTNLRHNAGLSHLPPPNPLKATTTPPTPMFYTLFLLRQMRH